MTDFCLEHYIEWVVYEANVYDCKVTMKSFEYIASFIIDLDEEKSLLLLKLLDGNRLHPGTLLPFGSQKRLSLPEFSKKIPLPETFAWLMEFVPLAEITCYQDDTNTLENALLDLMTHFKHGERLVDVFWVEDKIALWKKALKCFVPSNYHLIRSHGIYKLQGAGPRWLEGKEAYEALQKGRRIQFRKEFAVGSPNTWQNKLQ